jgi:hypothetical protein
VLGNSQFILYIASVFLILQCGKKEVHGITGVRWGYPASYE